MAEELPVYRVKLDPLKMGDPTVEKTSVLPSRIFLDPQLKPAATRVLGLLASVAEWNGHRYVRVGWLANHLGITERSVRRHLSNLKAAGYITSEPLYDDTGRQGINRYRIILDDQEGKD
ncbi:helix-turn-helix domain-containing protein [Desulfurivibrio sp. C05AmB]|uniref:helix-turn-helix domain-containing protein n=1 Tax=Desulfurivibrio sp. C05AmB TaxID=3374371 RepID=UPI00376EE740